jgi:two-component system, chemotaxis family, CheB/CheR fusion protein
VEKRVGAPLPSELQKLLAEDSGLDRHIDKVLLGFYSPAAMVVSLDFQVLGSRGNLAPFFPEASQGPAGDLLLPPETAIGAAVRRLVDSAARSAVRQTENILFWGEDASRYVRITVLPPASALPVPVFVAVFELIDWPARPSAERAPGMPRETGPERVQRRESELATARRQLQAVLEDYESTTDELRTAHEELRTANEELMSACQDFAASEKGLQSANHKLRDANRELWRTNDEFLAVLNNIEIPLVVLDTDLRIRRFSSRAREFFGIAAVDLGRPIDEIPCRVLPPPDLAAACRTVLRTLETAEREVQSPDGLRFVLSIRPFRNSDKHVGGLVAILTPS